MKRNFRKPLIIAGPKTLLRLSECTSRFDEIKTNKSFRRVINYKENSKKLIILTSGKFVY